jgi:hypothetical protein
MPFISSECARSLLPSLPFDTVSEMLDFRNTGLSPMEKTVLYLHYLVARGVVQEVVDYLDSLEPDTKFTVVNETLYQTYFGNVLHTCAYWNPTYDGLVIYRHLISAGARPVRDYYDNLPWEVDGSVYVCPLRGNNVSDGDDRCADEFTEFHTDIKRHFHEDYESPPPPALLIPAASDISS